ncbi:MAG TPA: hypothetical protein DCS66_00340 [Flavobacteriaceae bacterium]|nr:hypothetical protein [Flavobacteriaceae bacterium]
MEDLWILGPGASLNHHKEDIIKLGGANVMAFQRTFPNCVHHFDLVPSHWFSADPFPWLEGFEFLHGLPESEKDAFRKMEILIPHYAASSFATFRMYAGTTPLGRVPGGWDRHLVLLEILQKEGFNIRIVDCVTTKYLHTNTMFQGQDIFDTEAYVRFMSDKLLLGTVPFDSESVVGDRFKWGLENKLSSAIFPIAYLLRAKNLYIAGFDLKGPRFYSEDTRHPWNDETQTKSLHEYPLTLIKKWVKWEQLHGMRIFNVVDEGHTLLSEALPYKPMSELLRV